MASLVRTHQRGCPSLSETVSAPSTDTGEIMNSLPSRKQQISRSYKIVQAYRQANEPVFNVGDEWYDDGLTLRSLYNSLWGYLKYNDFNDISVNMRNGKIYLSKATDKTK